MFAVFASLLIVPLSLDAKPAGRLVDLGGHRLHINCTGRGHPTVVIETGLGDFSFDWILVQRRVEHDTRVCTYDRAGYAWSDPGPQPRTFDQLNLELHDALARAGERGPFVLVGHSFGGGPVRSFAERYRADVAGLILVDIVSEHQYIPMGPHAGRIADDAKGREIPVPREDMRATDAPAATRAADPVPIEPPYDRLPAPEQRLHAWAAAQPSVEAAENSQRDWSTEYFARWANQPQKGVLGALPLIVLTRAHGGYGDNLDMPAAQLERVRLEAQRSLADLSSRGTQRIVSSGHSMHLEAPDVVAQAIRDVVAAARHTVRCLAAGHAARLPSISLPLVEHGLRNRSQRLGNRQAVGEWIKNEGARGHVFDDDSLPPARRLRQLTRVGLEQTRGRGLKGIGMGRL